MASSSSLSLLVPSSSLSRNWEHDVFPSFHGPDVRTTFLSHVLKEFRIKGINTFIDNGIKRGESIGPELKRAIRGAKIAIVLLSHRYASSSWCLDELVEIMNCREEFSQTVMTIFYKVDPTDVNKQNGEFGKVFKETCQGKTKERIETWTKALEGVATIAGYHSTNWIDEAAMIETIAIEISNKLNITAPSRDLDLYIGMRAHMERLKLLLRLDLDDVRMIGIWGPPGIGKSTIARVLFNQISSSFQMSAIMVNIKGSYPQHCLDEYSTQLQLQSNMLSQMLNQNDMVITHLGVAQERLKGKKVFLVLDDVDRLAQLVALAEKNQWFGLGSRIVITTEDRSVLRRHGITEDDIYKVDFPTPDEAFQMFCMYAFGQKYPKDGFTELAREVTWLVGDLPLALKVMGSHFRGRSKDEWTKTLPRLRRLDRDIENILKFSYDALDEEDKDLFLHIACFFGGEKIEKVVEHLEEKFPDVRQRLEVLHEKSLIQMNGLGTAGMHNLFYKLGRDIHRKQFLKDSRDVAGRGRVTCAFIFCENPYKFNIDEKTFEGMSQLQFLKVDQYLSHGLSYLSPKTQLLDWTNFPVTCFPSVNVEFLVELKMRYSKLKKLWKGNKSLENLKWVDLSYSSKLKKLPNLSTAISLQKLILNGCSSLKKLPSSIGNAINLRSLSLSYCSSLVEVPASIGNLHNLKLLTLSGCSKLEVLLVNVNLESLERLDLSGCSSLKVFPEISTNVRKLNLSETAIEEVPSSIRTWGRLQLFTLEGCKKLLSLPQFPESLRYLNAVNCESLERLDWSFSNSDMYLDFGNCFRLNEDARDVIIQKKSGYLGIHGLPGKEIPRCFTHRANGDSLILKLDKMHFPSTLEFTACILLGTKNDIQNGDEENDVLLELSITDKDNLEDNWDSKIINYPRTDHLYIFKFEADATSHELFFKFSTNSDKWMIKECGMNYGDCEGEEETNEGDSAETNEKKMDQNGDTPVVIDTISNFTNNSEAGCSKSNVIDMGFDEEMFLKPIYEHGDMVQKTNALLPSEISDVPSEVGISGDSEAEEKVNGNDSAETKKRKKQSPFMLVDTKRSSDVGKKEDCEADEEVNGNDSAKTKKSRLSF